MDADVSASTLVWELGGNWDFGFHDADGNTIDVRKFWPEVIAEVQKRLQSFEQWG